MVLTAGLESAATAAEWSMNVHCFFITGVIVSNLDDGYQGKSVYTNREIFLAVHQNGQWHHLWRAGPIELNNPPVSMTYKTSPGIEVGVEGAI